MNPQFSRPGSPGFKCFAIFGGLLVGAVAALASPIIQSTMDARQVVPFGRALTLGVAATGSGQLSYQWWRSGRAIPGATSATYTVTDAKPWKDAGWYDVVVSDSSGASISAPIFVNVATSPHTILTWGTDDWGHAPGEVINRNLPETIGVTGLFVGGYYAGDFMLALRADGAVSSWGYSDFGALSVPTGLNNVVTVATSGTGAIALKADGTAVSWGFQSVFADSLATAVRNLTGVVSVAAAAYPYMSGPAVAALKQNGTVTLISLKRVNATSAAYVVTTTAWPGLSDATALCSGGNFVAVLRADGSVVVSGESSDSGTSVAPVPTGLTDITAIAGGYDFLVGLKTDGTVAVWGNNPTGALTPPAGLRDVVAVAAGSSGSHILALKSDGTVVAWGYPGIDATKVPASAQEVSLIAAGGYFSIAARTQTSVVADLPATPAGGNTGTGSTSGSTSSGGGSTSTTSTQSASSGGGAVSPWFLMSVTLVWLVRRRQQVRSGLGLN